MSVTEEGLSRRSVLAGVTGAAALVGLAGCGAGSGPGEGGSGEGATSVDLPSYVPFSGAQPDLAATADGVDAGYRRYPTERPQSVAQRPGNGSDALTAMANIYVAIPPGPQTNTWWSQLNERLGVDMQMSIVPAADYGTRFSTTIAGNDLPDMMQMQAVANFPQLLEARFTQLDEHLSGDAIRDYPNLANIPPFAWQNVMFGGHIYGIPIPRGRVGSYDLVRTDILAERGLSPEISGGWEGFLDMCREVTDARSRRWAYSLMSSLQLNVLRINEVPNQWTDVGGTLTHMYQSEQYKQAIADLITLWQAGVVHPDAFSPSQPFKQLFYGGNSVVQPDGYTTWTYNVSINRSNPDFEQGMLTLPTRDGSGPAPWIPGPGFASMNSLKQQDDPERIKLALRVCDYLAAPFGSQEQLFTSYGIEGTHHGLDAEGNPTLTDAGLRDITVPTNFLAAPPWALYQPGRPDDVDLQHAYQTEVLSRASENPAQGLYSNTAATDGASANSAHTSAVNEIIQGRQPFSALDDLIATWLTAAGSGIKRDFEEQLQAGG